MEERELLRRAISRFNRKAKLKLVSIPTYSIELFKRPIPRVKPFYLTQSHPQKITPENTDMLNVDDDVMLTQEREKYIILFIAQDEVDAKEKYGIIARTSGSGSTSPTHKLPEDFSVSLQEEAIIIRGSLETLLTAIEHLCALEYLSENKKVALCKEVKAVQDRESDTESSGSTTPRETDSDIDDESAGHELVH